MVFLITILSWMAFIIMSIAMVTGTCGRMTTAELQHHKVMASNKANYGWQCKTEYHCACNHSKSKWIHKVYVQQFLKNKNFYWRNELFQRITMHCFFPSSAASSLQLSRNSLYGDYLNSCFCLDPPMFPSPWRNYCSANHSLLGRSQPANESSILPCHEYDFVATSQGQAIQEMNSSRPHEYHLCHE